MRVNYSRVQVVLEGQMLSKALLGCSALIGAASLAATGSPAAASGSVTVDMGQSSQDFALYGQGAIAPGIGSFTVGQGSSVYDPGSNTSTFTLSGTITGGSTGFNSGSYAFITKFSGPDTPEAGPNAPPAQSNPSNTNVFFYDTLDPSTSMKLVLTGTPTGNHTIPLVKGGNFVGPNFFFSFASASCTGVTVCGQNNVGLTPGATIFGPVTLGATFAAPEPATWAMMLLGFGALGGMMRGRRAHAA
jgi:hypothetical protein